MNIHPQAPGLLPVRGRHTGVNNPSKMVAHTRLPRLVAKEARHNAVLNHAAHSRHLQLLAAHHHVAGRSADNRQHLSGPVDAYRRHTDMRVHVAHRYRRPHRQAQLGRHGRAKPAGTAAERRNHRAELFLHHMLHARVQRLKKVRRGVARTLVPKLLVTGSAGIAALLPGQLPHNPIRRLNPAVHGLINLRRLL